MHNWRSAAIVFLVCHVLHPLDRVAVHSLGHCDVSHSRSVAGAMPMLFASVKPDSVTGRNLLARPALALHPSTARRDDQDLTGRMSVPCGSGARLERHESSEHISGAFGLDQRIAPNSAGESVGRSTS